MYVLIVVSSPFKIPITEIVVLFAYPLFVVLRVTVVPVPPVFLVSKNWLWFVPAGFSLGLVQLYAPALLVNGPLLDST